MSGFRWTGEPTWVLLGPDKAVVEVNIEPRAMDMYAVGDQILVTNPDRPDEPVEFYVLLEKRGRWLALVDELVDDAAAT